MTARTRAAPERDASIATYRAKRDFTVTAEPAPSEAATPHGAPIFVVQKHDASRLHWDFRLEHGGVLWSWAVPRGPSLDPRDKRLAVHVEDHPIPYAEFQGTIPEGQYGAGVVETWDRGTWRALGEDAAADLARGEMRFELDGVRLRGRFVLIRLRQRAREHAENWLLVKEHDQHQRDGLDAAALEAEIALPDTPSDQVARAVAEPPASPPSPRPSARIVVARAPARPERVAEGVRVSHPDRELWPGITKADLAAYWQTVAPHALPEIAHRPLALVRCPDGVTGEHFFQKHPSQGFPPQLHAGEADGAPYLALDDAAGLVAATQMSAIELHAWGATLADPLHPERLVFDLDPGEGVGIADLVAGAREVRERLAKLGLASFCRTSGGKGLHVVASLRPSADWDTARAWCRAFAELMAADSPGRYVAAVKKSIRGEHILIDWLRNGLGSTAIASFSPRARPGAGVATRLSWREVTPQLDLGAYNLRTVPARLRRQRADPWADFAAAAAPLPNGRR